MLTKWERSHKFKSGLTSDMAKITSQAIENLLDGVGGKDNIASLTHCITRLRFVLKDPSMAKPDFLEEQSFVKGVFNNAGQFQVVIGPAVADYYQRITASTGVKAADKEELKQVARKNMNIVERAVSHMAEIFVPLLPAIIVGGLILGFRNLIGDIALVDGKTLASTSPFWATVHSFLWLPGEAIFHFLPVGVCWSVVKKMGGSPILGIVLGISLVSPQLMNAYNIGQTAPDVWNFGWFAIEKVGYQAQVIPAILAGLVLSVIELRLRRIVPASLQLVVVPFFALLITIILSHAFIGPVGRAIGNAVALAAETLLTGPFAIIGSALFGFLYAPLVITGIHHTTNAVELQLMQQTGSTMIFPLLALSNIAQGAAAFAMAWVYKKPQDRELSIPSGISAWLGVTEPAMYGVNLKYKYPMVCAMIGSGIAGGLAGWLGVMANGIGVGGLPGILTVQPSFWLSYLICIAVAIVVPVVLTLMVAKRKSMQQKTIPLATAL